MVTPAADRFIYTTDDVLLSPCLWDRPLFLRVLRQVRKTGGQGPCFGEDFLWVLLAAKEGAA